jgi:hypothetical protein
VKRFLAMPFADLPKILNLLRARPGNDVRALEFLIVTASRTGIVSAHHAGIKGDTSTVPAARKKYGRKHVVPLVSAACALLKRLPRPVSCSRATGASPTSRHRR